MAYRLQKNLHYKSDWAMLFDTSLDIIQKIFNILRDNEE